MSTYAEDTRQKITTLTLQAKKERGDYYHVNRL